MVCSGRPKWIVATLFGLAIASTMVGCASAPSADDSPSGADSRLLEYRRQGGIAGWDDHLIIWSSRLATLERRTGKRDIDLDPQLVDQLLDQLESVEFTTLKPEYLPQVAGADLIEYELTYEGHTVRMVDTAVPESLRPILDLLDAIIRSGALS